MHESIGSKDYKDHAEELLKCAKQEGADSADVVMVQEYMTSVCVRLGKLETAENYENAEFSLRVFVGNRVASVSASFGGEVKTVAQRAVAMAKASPEDPFQALADSALLVSKISDLDLFDATCVPVSDLKEQAMAGEAAALSVSGVTNSSGSHASSGATEVLLMTSHGFYGRYKASHFSRSISVIAGEGTEMQGDYDYSRRLHYSDLDSAEILGHRAGERAVRRLYPKHVKTGKIDVVFDPREGRSLLNHFASAVNGASVARKTSFLQDMMHKKIMSSSITITDDPLKKRASGSRPFDGEGIAGKKLVMVNQGVLKNWFLSSSVARELNMKTNGRGVRASSSVVPSYTNIAIEPGVHSPEDLIKEIKNGFYVTELIGQGVDMVTGEYSRGASGYWIENGEITFPVSGVSIASNLKDMFLSMTPAHDVNWNFSVAVPTLRIEGMVLAGI